MFTWGGNMFALEKRVPEIEDFNPGMTVLTPSRRRAIVKKTLTGASKIDPFPRVVCTYEGGGPKDLVTLQPHQLTIVQEAPKREPRPVSFWEQMALAFA